MTGEEALWTLVAFAGAAAAIGLAWLLARWSERFYPEKQL